MAADPTDYEMAREYLARCVANPLQAAANRLVYVVLAECRLIFPEAQAPQPDHNVHGSAPQSGGGVHHVLVHKRCLSRVQSRLVQLEMGSHFWWRVF